MKQLLGDKDRNSLLRTTQGDIIFDMTHSKLDGQALDLLRKVADETKIFDKIQ